MVWAIVSRNCPKRRDRRRPDHAWKIVAETVHAWCRRPSRLSCQPRRTSAATDIRNFLKQRRVRLPSVDFAAADPGLPTGVCLMVCPSSMALIEIVCPRCGRHGYVPGTRLPGVLVCSQCRLARLVRQGQQTIRSRTAAQINADGVPYQPKEASKQTRKRVLVPRVPTTT